MPRRLARALAIAALLLAGLCPMARSFSVTVAWDPSPSGANVLGYRVKRRTADTAYTVVGTTPQTTATLSGLSQGRTYYFIVTAYNATQESDPSNEISYFALPMLNLKRGADNSLIVTSQVQVGASYTLERSPDLNTWTTVETFTAASSVYTYTAINHGEPSMFFRIKINSGLSTQGLAAFEGKLQNLTLALQEKAGGPKDLGPADFPTALNDAPADIPRNPSSGRPKNGLSNANSSFKAPQFRWDKPGNPDTYTYSQSANIPTFLAEDY